MTRKSGTLPWCIAALMLGVFAARTLALDASRQLTQYLHRIWQVQQGLPQATIYAVVQGEEGYLWLGTQRGLYRFDGVRFSTVDAAGAEPLAAAWIRDIVSANDGSVWVATNEDGLYHIAGGVVTHTGLSDGLPANRVNRLMRDKAGNIWACTGDGLAMIRGATGAVAKVFQMQQGLSGNDVTAVCQDEQGRVWAACAGKMRLNLLQGDLFVQQEIMAGSAGTIHDLMGGRAGKVWIATSAGLVALSGQSERTYGTSDGLTGGDVYRLMQSADATVWVGMKDGFARLKPGGDKFENYTAAEGLSQSTVYALAEDREGSLWVGTKHGLNQFLDGRTVPFTTSEGLPSNETGPLLQDIREGAIWIGTFGAGLCRLEGGAITTVTVKEGLASDSVRALAQGLTGELWVGTDRGVNRVEDGKVTVTFGTNDGLPSEDVRCLLMDRAGNLWAGTTGGIAQLRVGEKKWIQPAVTAGQAWGGNAGGIAAMTEVGDAIWAARESGGLVVIDGGIAKTLLLEGDPVKDVDAFYRDIAGLLWMGMRGGGLGLWDGHKVEVFGVGQGLFDDDLRGITGDDQGRLWMACSKGIFYVARADLDRLAGGTLKSVVSTPFSPTEGLRTIECRSGVQPGTWRMADGRVWFSTIRGVISIDPAKLQRKLPPLPLVIEQVLVDGKEELRAGAAAGEIGPGVKNVEFRYTGLSFVAPAKLVFRYQLEGFDKAWVDAGMRREAYYTNLPAGKYRFRVQGSYGDGAWSEVKMPLGVDVAAYFWQRWWFWPACGGLVVLGLAAAYQMRLREERRRLATIFAERGRIARELHDTLIQGFSGVTMEMQAFLGKLSGEQEKRGLAEIIRDAGNCLREARQSIAGLRQLDRPPTEFAEMVAAVARELTTGKPVRLLLKLGGGSRLPPLAAEVEYNLIRIVREAITNALRHAHARTVEVTLDAAAARLELEVRDDGRGFDLHEVGMGEGHFGLIGMRERGKEIGATVDVASAPLKGTVVRVILEARGR